MAAAGEKGLRLLGVVHGGGRRTPIWEPAEDPCQGEGVRYRDLAALVYPGSAEVARVDPEEVRAHHQRLDPLFRRVTVVPAPYGIAFAGEREVARFLRAAYRPLTEALLLLEGRWEFRVHLSPRGEELPEALALDLGTRVYGELRRISHAGIPFPRSEPGVLSAAFLVDRLETRRFLERVEELDAEQAELSLDATGPWPAYDFVTMRP